MSCYEPSSAAAAPPAGGGVGGPPPPSEDPRTNLIVNYLPQSTTEEELRTLFGGVGPVASAKVIMDKVKGHSLQYGFVNFVSPGDAARAVDTLNGRRLQAKSIKVSYARPSSDAIKDANIYIADLPRTMTLQDVEALFAPHGRIIHSHMLTDEQGRSRGAAFVRFDRRAQAEEATRALNGHRPPGAAKRIRISKPILCPGPGIKAMVAAQREQQAAAAQQQMQMQQRGGEDGLQRTAADAKASGGGFSVHHNKHSYHHTHHHHQQGGLASSGGAAVPRIFIYNLEQDADEELIRAMFGAFGGVTDVKVIRDFRTNKCRGLAFVTMARYEDAILAIRELNGHRVGDKVLQVSFKVEDFEGGLGHMGL